MKNYYNLFTILHSPKAIDLVFNYLTLKKEQIWVSWKEMDEPRACYIEWSKSERKKQMLMNIYEI